LVGTVLGKDQYRMTQKFTKSKWVGKNDKMSGNYGMLGKGISIRKIYEKSVEGFTVLLYDVSG